MVQKRKRYDRQFKLSAAKLVIEEGMPVRELSEELSIKAFAIELNPKCWT